MTIIQDLAARKIEAHDHVLALGMTNTSDCPVDRVRNEIQYRAAFKAWMAATDEFNAAFDNLTPDQLEALIINKRTNPC